MHHYLLRSVVCGGQLVNHESNHGSGCMPSFKMIQSRFLEKVSGIRSKIAMVTTPNWQSRMQGFRSVQTVFLNKPPWIIFNSLRTCGTDYATCQCSRVLPIMDWILDGAHKEKRRIDNPETCHTNEILWWIIKQINTLTLVQIDAFCFFIVQICFNSYGSKN